MTLLAQALEAMQLPEGLEQRLDSDRQVKGSEAYFQSFFKSFLRKDAYTVKRAEWLCEKIRVMVEEALGKSMTIDLRESDPNRAGSAAGQHLEVAKLSSGGSSHTADDGSAGAFAFSPVLELYNQQPEVSVAKKHGHSRATQTSSSVIIDPQHQTTTPVAIIGQFRRYRNQQNYSNSSDTNRKRKHDDANADVRSWRYTEDDRSTKLPRYADFMEIAMDDVAPIQVWQALRFSYARALVLFKENKKALEARVAEDQSRGTDPDKSSGKESLADSFRAMNKAVNAVMYDSQQRSVDRASDAQGASMFASLNSLTPAEMKEFNEMCVYFATCLQGAEGWDQCRFAVVDAIGSGHCKPRYSASTRMLGSILVNSTEFFNPNREAQRQRASRIRREHQQCIDIYTKWTTLDQTAPGPNIQMSGPATEHTNESGPALTIERNMKIFLFDCRVEVNWDPERDSSGRIRAQDPVRQKTMNGKALAMLSDCFSDGILPFLPDLAGTELRKWPRIYLALFIELLHHHVPWIRACCYMISQCLENPGCKVSAPTLPKEWMLTNFERRVFDLVTSDTMTEVDIEGAYS